MNIEHWDGGWESPELCHLPKRMLAHSSLTWPPNPTTRLLAHNHHSLVCENLVMKVLVGWQTCPTERILGWWEVKIGDGDIEGKVCLLNIEISLNKLSECALRLSLDKFLEWILRGKFLLHSLAAFGHLLCRGHLYLLAFFLQAAAIHFFLYMLLRISLLHLRWT